MASVVGSGFAVGSGLSRTLIVAAAALTVLHGQTPAPAATDALFARFFAARTAAETTAATAAIASSGISFDEAIARLKRGRIYPADVPKGVVQASYRSDS